MYKELLTHIAKRYSCNHVSMSYWFGSNKKIIYHIINYKIYRFYNWNKTILPIYEMKKLWWYIKYSENDYFKYIFTVFILINIVKYM